MFLKVILLPQKGKLDVSNIEESVVCLIEKVVDLSFRNKSQIDEIISKEKCHLQSFLFF